MSKEAIIQATYADMKLVRTRSCAQLIFEIPIEQAAAAIEAFGVPLPGKEVWCAIARLDLTKAASEPAKAEKPRQKWESLPLSQQAAIRCGEEAFWRFLREERGFIVDDQEDAAIFVRGACNVHSRSEIGKTEASAKAWRDLDGAYQYWQRVYA